MFGHIAALNFYTLKIFPFVYIAPFRGSEIPYYLKIDQYESYFLLVCIGFDFYI